ncbi:MAG: prephenate dehydrogenase/arogenate dehydrogenase family protein [Kiritimatiellae bacterium]|nr:prephenate dehydrogenase/arogenate dehydrogenase family protein [Kiritimatiellia bacterium]
MGGSVARDLRRTGFASRLVGVDNNSAHAAQALSDGLVDEMAPFEVAVARTDLTVLAVPVDAVVRLLPRALEALPPRATVVDLGSTKGAATATVRGHPRRGRYVALHPMAGTEQAGPKAAVERLFQGKIAIVCDAADSDADALRAALALLEALGMRPVNMESCEHDRQVAYLSHLPHLVSFALALAALEQQRDAGTILNLAGGGFASMVRIAQSTPAMWTPILLQNRAAVLEALTAFSRQIQALSEAIEAGDAARLHDAIAAANRIRTALAVRPPAES